MACKVITVIYVSLFCYRFDWSAAFDFLNIRLVNSCYFRKVQKNPHTGFRTK